jgi:hypothetical protein
VNALQFIEWALQDIRAIGIGRAVTDEEASRALTRLNSMLAGWAADGLLVPYRNIESLTLTQGTNPHTIGSGGTLNTADYIMFRNQRWDFTVTGGEVQRTGNHIALAFRSGTTTGNATTTAEGAMTVAGGLVNNAGFLVTIGQQNTATALGTGHLNLNAGTLITNQILDYNATGVVTTARVNFNGGLLRASANTTLFLGTTGSGGTGTLNAYVNGAFGNFAGGGVIDSNGFNVAITTGLLAPTGDGVSGIALTSGGGGYSGAPYVEITGGGGSGATASATVDLDPASSTFGQVLAITVTNPGVGYTSAPTVTLLGGDQTTPPKTENCGVSFLSGLCSQRVCCPIA